MKPVDFETHPDRYRHWKLTIDAPVATLAMDVDEDGGLSSDYALKLNSYDLAVDIELNDAIQRLRFEHPEVHAVAITSLKDRIFCAGANIFMLGRSDHGFKVNFCKYTNIFLVDDGNSAVSLPEVPLLGVLPGTGGLTRVVDKRMVRRDLADFFSTVAEGVKGKRALEWGFVDQIHPKSRFDEEVAKRAAELAGVSDRPDAGPGITLEPLSPDIGGDDIAYRHVHVGLDRDRRTASITINAPDAPQGEFPDAILEAGSDYWPLRAFRELDHALLHLRLNEPEIGTLVLRTEGDAEAVLAVDAVLDRNKEHWLVREIVHFMKRTLKRLDLTARSTFALIEPGSCFAGSLFEIALSADRSYMLDDPDRPNFVSLSAMNAGTLPMGNGLSRLATRFLAQPDRVSELLAHEEPFAVQEALEAGLVSFAPDDIDWEDEVRLLIEERASLSPDALTGMEANLRFAGPETLETKIFGRLSAWQNWIFQRPNAVGEKGALKVYGKSGVRPEFEWRRT
jgi:benzoyl-CoA-dihydrodiol lyase